MITINILTNNQYPCSRAFNFPLILSKGLLKRKGVKINFVFSINEQLYNSDILFINSNVFRTYWTDKKQEIFNLFEKAKKQNQKIFWFDTTDSTWSTQFEVLPYVDQFLKNQIFLDRDQYLVKYRTGRIFTDYFDDLYQTNEADYKYLLPEKDMLKKINVGWSSCFENYNELRYSIVRKIANTIRPFTCNVLPQTVKMNCTSPASHRTQNISARFGLSHSKKSVVAHRQTMKNKLEKMGVDCSRISLPEYFKELQNSYISISPFGVGEFCYRDYESIVCGAALVKPDMSHMQTWPDLYQENITYIPHRWDLSDFEEVIEKLLKNPDICRDVAEKAQNLYKHALSEEGMKEFAERVVNIVNK